jgi:hypothetical protein
LDAADLRHIATRTVVRTEQGEVEVEIPERDEAKPEAIETVDEVRESIRVQAKVVELGAALGFTVWVPAGDRGRVSEQLPTTVRDKLVTALPLNYNRRLPGPSLAHPSQSRLAITRRLLHMTCIGAPIVGADFKK